MSEGQCQKEKMLTYRIKEREGIEEHTYGKTDRQNGKR